MTYILAQASAHRIPLRDESVQTCVTSPPYWGLRAYAGEQAFVWGGEDHEHEWGDTSRVGGGKQNAEGKRWQHTGGGVSGHGAAPSSTCPCGAWYGALGLEPTPDLFIAHMVEVFREVKRVLRKDGTLWLNLGDSYAANWSSMRPQGGGVFKDVERERTKYPPPGLKSKDLVGIPWRVALALQADGWYLRSDIIWAKPNPMPESVTDRPTKSHEYVFLLAKGQWSERSIPFANLEPERVHLGRYLGAQNPAVSAGAKFGVEFATALFNRAQEQHDFRLPPFYAEEWKQLPQGNDSDFVAHLPPEHRLAAHAARFLDGDTSTPQFLGEIDRLWGDLSERHHLLVGRGLTQGPNPPHVLVDGDGAIRVDYPGEIGKIEFAHHRIVVTVPTACSYFYDADAIREAVSPHTHSRGEGIGVKNAGTEFGQGIKHNEDYARAINGPVSNRNARTVWNIATQPYPGSHFATFPEELPERCIKAGSSTGDVILDPFNGSGTTGRVAMRLGRRYVGLDLSREYLTEQAIARVDPLSDARRKAKDGGQQVMAL